MNTAPNQLLDLQSALKAAEKVARKRSRKAYIMSKLLIPRKKRNYLYLCYAYLRRVDDTIDNPEINLTDKKTFIAKQQEFIFSLSSDLEPKQLSDEEYYLHYFFKYAKKNNQLFLIEEVGKMVEAMNMDVLRLERDGVFSEKELSRHISIQTNSMFNLVHAFLMKGNYSASNYENLGLFLWHAATLRDLLEDYQSGYLNIDLEEIKKFNIDIGKFEEDNNVKQWMKYKIPIVLEVLNDEIDVLQHLPFKIKIFWSVSYPYYIHKIIKLKTYNYSFINKIETDLGKEIKSYWFTFSTSIKMYSRIFKFKFSR